MRVTVTSRHAESTPAIEAYAREKAGKLEHHLEGLRSVTVTLDVGRRGHQGQMAEFIARIPGGGTCVSHGKGKSLYEAIDAAEDRLLAQLRRAKAKRERR